MYLKVAYNFSIKRIQEIENCIKISTWYKSKEDCNFEAVAKFVGGNNLNLLQGFLGVTVE